MKKAALEGMVLVKNEGNLLPIQKGTKIALFGKGTVDYVKGGGGSGDVTVAYSHSLLDGMKDKVLLYEALNEFYKENVKAQYAADIDPGMTAEPEGKSPFFRAGGRFSGRAPRAPLRPSGPPDDRCVR